MLRKIVLRGLDQLGLLVSGDAGGGAAEIRAAAHAHFHKNQRSPLAHDEIDLAETAAEIALDELKPLALQIARGQLLGGTAGTGGANHARLR